MSDIDPTPEKPQRKVRWWIRVLPERHTDGRGHTVMVGVGMTLRQAGETLRKIFQRKR